MSGLDALPVDFFERHWGKEPALLPALLDEAACTDGEMLEILRALSRRIKTKSMVNARFFVDGLQVTPEDPLERAFCVGAHERTLAIYVGAVTQRLSGREFCVVIDDAAVLNQGVWARMRGLAAEIVKCTGFPAGRIEYNAFVSTCRSTPFGIHRDRSHTFTLLAGSERKSMLAWTPEALTPIRGSRITKDQRRIDALARRASYFRICSVNDALYLPAGWWHASLKDDDCPFQATLALGFALEKTPAEDLAALVARELQAALEAGLESLDLDPERAGHALKHGMPELLFDLSTQNVIATKMARQLLSPGGGVMDAVEAALRLRTLRRLSGLVESTRTQNLEPVFPPCQEACRLRAASRVRLVSDVLRTKVAGQLVLAVNGSSFAVNGSTGPLLDSIRRLEEGEAVTVGELQAAGDPEVSRFLEFAWSFRALSIID